MICTAKINLSTCLVIVILMISSRSSAQFFGGDRVTLQGATGPSSPGYKLVSRDPRDIRYFLFHKRLDPDEFVELFSGDTRYLFNSTYFRRDRQVKVLIHGFNNNSTGNRFPRDTRNGIHEGITESHKPICSAYLENTEHNVILVDWGKLSTPAVPRRGQADVFYPVVVDNVPLVGESVAKFILFMLDNGIISKLNQVHFIGFSLGAHVSGYAGEYINRKRQEKVYRITGLDPAGPMFANVPEDGRLDKTDAEFVDVIHSSRLGLYDDIGHVDFYPNGGRYQFNCVQLNDQDNAFQTFRAFAKSLSDAAGSCGHARAPEYFTYSIRQGPAKVTACRCLSWREYLSTCRTICPEKITFGEYCPTTARGKYFLEINIRDSEG